jgi:hypothetical protein
VTRDALLKAIQEAAAENGGKAPGVRAFRKYSGVTRNDFHKAGFSNYGDAVAAAGLTPNALTAAPDASEVLDAVLAFTVKKGRPPTQAEMRVARIQDSAFPSEHVVVTLARARGKTLPALLLEHARAHGHDEAVRVLEAAAPAGASDRPRTLSARAKVTGHVYLLRHGQDYKIGRSNDVARRRREVALLLPQDLEEVHRIDTDDPEGIERYWHERFKPRHVRGEWFRLTGDDVAAFKRRRYQ